MLTVITSVSTAGPVAASGGAAGGGCASLLGPPEHTPPAAEAPRALKPSLSPLSPLVVGERHAPDADLEATALWPTHVVVREQDPPKVRVTLEDDPEEVEHFALLELRGREEPDAGVDLRQGAFARVRQQRLHPDPLDPVAVEKLVVDGEARLGRQVIGSVEAGEEAVALPGCLAQPAEHGEHVRGVDREHRPLLGEAGVDHGAGVRGLDLPPDQLQSGGVRHRSAPLWLRRPPPP